MDPIERLSSLFEKFPGIGPRQANRFVQFVLRSSPSTRRELIAAIQDVGSDVRQCPECMRYHAGAEKLCGICRNPNREDRTLAIVASDTDLAALERSGTYRGRYFVIGGTVSLASEKNSSLRTKQLADSLPDRAGKDLAEIVLAFPANPEGDATSVYVREAISDIANPLGIRITSLGRGLSTGSELEYADPDTIKSAFANRR